VFHLLDTDLRKTLNYIDLHPTPIDEIFLFVVVVTLCARYGIIASGPAMVVNTTLPPLAVRRVPLAKPYATSRFAVQESP
jgi:hypothetical protein